MANGYWIERIEITFWNFSISLMHRSRLVRALVPLAFVFLQHKTRLRRLVQIAFWSFAGLVTGMMIGFIKAWLV